MTRVKRGMTSRRRHNKILALTRGQSGGGRRLLKSAKEAAMKSLAYAYRDRRNRKRDFHRLWITRINAAARQEGLSYSRFMAGLHGAGIGLDRKVLADLAVREPAQFTQLAQLARSALEV
ncbi:MAG: 50S ribosomal protein L20 [Chloroflexi bacterium]|nr:50S ribosomal protein L20 [Chloroflexota bacterium]